MLSQHELRLTEITSNSRVFIMNYPQQPSGKKRDSELKYNIFFLVSTLITFVSVKVWVYYGTDNCG